MSNIRELQYDAKTSRCGITIEGKTHWFGMGDAYDARHLKAGHYGIRVEGRNYFFPVNPTLKSGSANPYYIADDKKISKTIPPLVFPRQKVDINFWREAIMEAELKPFNWRVLMQTIFQDTILDGHVFACWEKRKRMSLVKTPCYFKNRGKDRQPVSGFDYIYSHWWYQLSDFILDAQGYGYQLIELGDLINKGFPDLSVVPRQNISPDRLVVAPTVYMIDGTPFTKPKKDVYNFGSKSTFTIEGVQAVGQSPEGEYYADWHIWVPTPNIFSAHTSTCGYGIFYWASLYAILIRSNLSWNANFNEKFIKPILHMKSPTSGEEERQKTFDMLLKMGDSGALLSDLQEEITSLQNRSVGTGYEAYDKFEVRLQKNISALILGHQDAMHMIPGRMGNQQNKVETPVDKAMAEVEKMQDRWFSMVERQYVRPKLKNLGFDVPSDDVYFGYMNEKEDNDLQERINKNNLDYAKVLQLLSIAGYRVSADQILEATGLEVELAEPIDNNDPERMGNIAEPEKIPK